MSDEEFIKAAEFWNAELAKGLRNLRKLVSANADKVSIAYAFGPIFSAIDGLKQLVDDENDED